MKEESPVIKELEQRINELEKLLRVSMVLNSSLRLEDVLVMVLDQAMDTLQAEAGTLWLFTEDGTELLPLVARIIAVADTLDAMTTDRPYRKGRSFQEAYEEIERCSGTQFDPKVVAAFQQARDMVEEMFKR